MTVRIGLTALTSEQGGADLAATLDATVEELERHGIDSLWVSEAPSAPQIGEPLVSTAWALARTRRLKVGTSVLVLPGRNPMLTAAQLATLAALAPRRVLPVFGLRASRPGDRALFPVPRAQRGAVFDEAIAIVRELLTCSEVTFHGAHHHLDGASVEPRPTRPPDLWVAGTAPAALRRVGELGDGWLGALVTPADSARCRARIETAAAGVGRSIDQDHYGVVMIVKPGRAGIGDVSPVVRSVAAQRPDLEDPAALVCDGWANARAEIARFVDAGMSKFVVRPAGPVPSRRDFVDQFVHELGPLQT